MNPPAPTVAAADAAVAPALRMLGIDKAFGGVPALNDVTLEVARGEVHALMGENGAGKSTLMRILAGICRPDRGRIELRGQAVEIATPHTAQQFGIAMIHQELSPVPEMSVAENIHLGREPCHRWTPVVDRRRQRDAARRLLDEIGLDIDPDEKMRALSIAEMQMVEIVKAVSCRAEILIMDEPTSAITGREVGRLFGIIRDLKARGISIIYISHKMDEIFRVADTITVLRDGRYIDTKPARELDHDTLVRLMVGRKISELFPAERAPKGAVTIEVEGLTCRGAFTDISFTARKGEILGFAGLVGAGRTETMEALFGLREPDAGRIRLRGVDVQIKSPAEAIKAGLALISEDRQLQGLNLKASVRDNITLVNLKAFAAFGQIPRRRQENRVVDEQIRALRIKCHDRQQWVRTLSGGNQQKVVLAKWLLRNPEILILDEPTRGIDIGAKAEIYRLVNALAGEGRTILLISSELEEIIGLCDRVLVYYHGRISGEFERGAFSREAIIKAAMGNSNEHALPGN